MLTSQCEPDNGLRHSFASWLASSGQVSMYELQKLLTHSSPQMTQRYAHLHDDALRKASGVAGARFSAVQSCHEAPSSNVTSSLKVCRKKQPVPTEG